MSKNFTEWKNEVEELGVTPEIADAWHARNEEVADLKRQLE